MRLKTKRVSIASLGAVCALTLAAGASLLAVDKAEVAYAEDNAVPSSVYYYDNLTDAEGKEYTLAKKFYEALDKLNVEGDFKDGVVDYSLSENNLATSDMIEAWVTRGNLDIPKAFSAARDAYYMDHPELFYIDIYKVTISAASIGDTYYAYIDSGREANLYAKGEFTSESQVNKALTVYYNKIDEIANYAKTEADKDKYGTAKKVLQARYANQYIAKNVKYNDIAAADSEITTASAAQTAYGALVKGTSVCNGYTRAFKAVMDKLEIPCVVVGGYSISKNSQGNTNTVGEGHAWNYVWFETPADNDDSGVATQADNGGAWYAYDVTWNSTGKNVNTYIDMGRYAASKQHLTDGEVSTSGYILQYPELSAYNYGSKPNSDGVDYSDGIVYDIAYVGSGEYDDTTGEEIMETWRTVSYNQKSAVRLYKEDGLRIIYRQADMGKDGPNWSHWYDLYAEITIGPFGPNSDMGFHMYQDLGYETRIYGNPSILYTQFAVISGIDPNAYVYGEEYKELLTAYSKDINIGEYVVAESELQVNDTYLTYIAAPHVLTSNPDYRFQVVIRDDMAVPGTTIMDEKYAFTIEVKYTETLDKLNKDEPIGIWFANTHGGAEYTNDNINHYAKFLPVNDKGEFVELVNGDTLRFKFMPSLMYEHNAIIYSFIFSNVGSSKVYYDADQNPFTTNKAPNPAVFNFSRTYIACSKCLPNGRMLIDCVAQPMLVSNTDLSEVNFQDENGNYFSAGQRSQMMLVVNKPSEEEKDTMNKLLDEDNTLNVNQEDIKSAETYEIDLQICGAIAKIPNESYVKIALGFPEGCKFEDVDEGVTFKIYHYKRSADGKQIIGVEEIPCVVTKFGIVATVQSFSPFMVVAVDADKATTKNVYASVDGNGGKLNNEDGKIHTLNEGESYTYTIVPDKGYMIYSVTLNNKIVTDNVVNGKLTLSYDQLDANNELEIKYIANAAALRYNEKNIVEPVKVIVGIDGNASVVEGTGGKIELDTSGLNNNGGNKNVGIIVGIVVGVVVVLAAGAAVCIILLKKRQPAKATAAPAAKAKPAAVKPAAEKQPAKVPANVAKATAVASAEPTAKTKSGATTAAKPATTAKPAETAKPTATAKPATPAAKPTTKPTNKK